MMQYVPNILTLTRCIASPFILPFLIVYLSPMNSLVINSVLVGSFLFLSLTDWFDGYIARRYGLVSDLGATLDHVADKLLISSSLIALLAAGKIFFAWVVLFIAREFVVMGLRLLALERGTSVSVDWLGKVKTVLQTVYVAVLIVNPYQAYGVFGSVLQQMEWFFLMAAISISWWSAYRYYQRIRLILIEPQ